MMLSPEQKKTLKRLGKAEEFSEGRKRIYRENPQFTSAQKDEGEREFYERLVAEGEASRQAIGGADYGEDGEDEDVADLDDFGRSMTGAAPTEEDYRWVYQNYKNKSVALKDAPTPGAWGLLKEARKDTAFFKGIVDKLTPKTFAKAEGGEENLRALDLTGIDDKLKAEFGQLADVFGRSKGLRAEPAVA